MRTQTIIKTFYTFDELSDRAKSNACDAMRASGDMWDGSDWWASAKAFSDKAPITIADSDIERGDVDINWTDDNAVAELEGLRAWKWLQNNGWFDWAKEEKPGKCSLTGFCGDCPFADPLVEYSRNPLRVPDLKQVFYECAQAWVFEARDDLECAYSDESLAELAEANGWEFDEDGHWA